MAKKRNSLKIGINKWSITLIGCHLKEAIRVRNIDVVSDDIQPSLPSLKCFVPLLARNLFSSLLSLLVPLLARNLLFNSMYRDEIWSPGGLCWALDPQKSTADSFCYILRRLSLNIKIVYHMWSNKVFKILLLIKKYKPS